MTHKNKKMLRAHLESVDLNKLVNRLYEANIDNEEGIIAALATRLKNEVNSIYEFATDNTEEDIRERDRYDNWGR